MTREIARHKTAIRRTDLSRPLRLAIDSLLLQPNWSVFDYGCGHGSDVRLLSRLGFDCTGWDPVHAANQEHREADVVNLGFVVNVIEDPAERVEALRGAWSLARKVLLVSARLQSDLKEPIGQSYGDGCLTKAGTFQKFYVQSELREWVDAVLDQKGVAAAPGVFFVFKDQEERQRYLAARYRRRASAPVPRRSDQLFEAHRDLLEPLRDFVVARGRVPEADELQNTGDLVSAFRTIKQAFATIRRVTGPDRWTSIRAERAEDLCVFLGLAEFDGLPRFSELPREIQRDVRSFFGTYKTACAKAREVLLSAGDQDQIDQATRTVDVGKVTPKALYVHRDALPSLPTILRLYEGCARGLVGDVEEASIIKLNRWRPQVSYLSYPEFDRDPHPALATSVVVTLDTVRISNRDYTKSTNPPILHRKEEFVTEDYPGREKFARLTRQEERAGLFERTSRIGTRVEWDSALKSKGVALRGHRLVRNRGE